MQVKDIMYSNPDYISKKTSLQETAEEVSKAAT